MNKRMIGAGLVVVMAVTSLSGCAAFKRKFVRKRNVEKKEQFIPVLEPIAYPPAHTTAAQRYQQHYALWKVWSKELLQIVQKETNNKRVHFYVDQILIQMGHMREEISAERQEMLDLLITRMQVLQQYLDKPESIRNMKKFYRDYVQIDRELRNQWHDFKNL